MSQPEGSGQGFPEQGRTCSGRRQEVRQVALRGWVSWSSFGRKRGALKAAKPRTDWLPPEGGQSSSQHLRRPGPCSPPLLGQRTPPAGRRGQRPSVGLVHREMDSRAFPRCPWAVARSVPSGAGFGECAPGPGPPWCPPAPLVQELRGHRWLTWPRPSLSSPHPAGGGLGAG